MSLKKLSLILLTALYFEAYSMEEKKNEEPVDQSSATKLHKPKELRFFCAQQVLNKKIDTKILPHELKDYLEYINKLNELEKCNLVPVFKKYLIECLDNLPIDVLQQILDIIDKASEISSEKCLFAQRMIPSMSKTVFYDSPLLTLTTILVGLFPATFEEEAIKIFKKIRDFYTKKSEIENDPIIKFNLLLLDLMSFRHDTKFFETDCVKQLSNLADMGHAPSVFTLSKLRLADNQKAFLVIKDDIEKLIEMKAIDYAAELILDLISIQQPPFNVELPKDIFEKMIEKFIISITGENYKPDYSLILMTVYNYFGDKNLAKKHAKRFFRNNQDIFFGLLHKLLSEIYLEKGKNEKAEVHLKRVKEFEDLIIS